MSSSDVEILPLSKGPPRRASASTSTRDSAAPEDTYSYEQGSRDANAAPGKTSNALKQAASQVIELSDGSEDDEMQVLGYIAPVKVATTKK